MLSGWLLWRKRMAAKELCSSKFIQYRYINALVWFLALVVVQPFFVENLGVGSLVGQIGYTLMLLSCWAAIVVTSRRMLFLTFLGLYSLYSTWFHVEWTMSGEVAAALFFALCSVYIQIDLWRGREVTIDTLLGSILGLLLVASSFAFLFSWISLLEPGSIRGIEHTPEELRILPFLYFSFVNISTLGYGDIVPVTHGVRNLAALEAVFGQFYFASLVARLISLHGSNGETSSS